MQKISHAQRIVLIALTCHEDEDALARDLAAETGLKLRPVVGALQRLEDRKMVRRTVKVPMVCPSGFYDEVWRWQATV